MERLWKFTHRSISFDISFNALIAAGFDLLLTKYKSIAFKINIVLFEIIYI